MDACFGCLLIMLLHHWCEMFVKYNDGFCGFGACHGVAPFDAECLCRFGSLFSCTLQHTYSICIQPTLPDHVSMAV